MKKLFTILLLSVLSIAPLFAQETKIDEKTIANMTQSELEAYQKVLKVQQANTPRAIVAEPSKLKEYAEVGKAFGTAFKECWSAVSTDVERFAQSPAGKWAMVLVSWKIMGHDAVEITTSVVQWFVGIGLLSVGIPFWVFIFYRNCVSKKVLLTSERTGLFTVKKTYAKDLSSPIHGDEGAPLLYGVSFLIYLGVVSLIMFL